MTTLSQVKSLMKSGDIVGAEALCRGHHANRDVSTKRPRMRGQQE
jgi:EAL domain-containing protein (putative c-di-GMP-specific phosphodiesterase class I)